MPETVPLGGSLNMVEENLRIAALRSFDVLDTPREEAFDRITRLIQNIFNVPIAFISLMDEDRLWHKACLGLDEPSVDRKLSFCELVVQSGEPVVIPDLTQDERLRDSVFVTGEAQLRFYAGVPLISSEGQVIGTVCAADRAPRIFADRDRRILVDLAAVVMNELELRRSAEVDVLTGVLSRRAFKIQAVQALAMMARQRRSASLLMVDVDHFKSINDTYGHAVGDRVLSAVAAICQQQVRSTDIIGRLGGEEFAVLLPGSDSVNGSRSADKIRIALSEKHFDIGNVSLRITASFGVSFTGTLADDNLDSLLHEADISLYAAKNRGRNRVVCLQQEALTSNQNRA